MSKDCDPSEILTFQGKGGETKQQYKNPTPETNLTTNQGIVISDNQNSLKVGSSGPTLLEDFILREKISHFDHERIPERIVHARGAGAHGYFRPAKNLKHITKAKFLSAENGDTPVFVRFSTVAGGAGSNDVVRDVRGFAVKFYTEEGNFDLVGNNIPVFFIQDAIKFPDLIHSVKMEPNSGVPQASSAHSTFWDFISLMPESMNMVMWVMSDRAIPRSYRMMDGFGIHTFKFINECGKATFVKFHWRTTIGATSNIWGENVKLSGLDADFFRRDLYNSIEKGQFPEYDLYVQLFDEEFVEKFQFSVFDATKIIPEELVPLEHVGKLVLNRNPDNFFAETEQIAFCPANIVPGIDFSEDPLLQGRIFSYLDTQLIRLGGPNFTQIPINQPRCPMQNFQRDGFHQTIINKGRVAYEPNSLCPLGPRENPVAGFRTYPTCERGKLVRNRPSSFADHYSQARQFWKSMTKPEKEHIVNAFVTELSNIDSQHVRLRVLGLIYNVSKKLYRLVSGLMGMEGQRDIIDPIVPAQKLPPSPVLSQIRTFVPTLVGRTVGIIITDGISKGSLDKLIKKIKENGGNVTLIGPTISDVIDSHCKPIKVDTALQLGGSPQYDACVLFTSSKGIDTLNTPLTIEWLNNAFYYLQAIGYTSSASKFFTLANLNPQAEGIVKLTNSQSYDQFIDYAKDNKIWNRDTSFYSGTNIIHLN